MISLARPEKAAAASVGVSVAIAPGAAGRGLGGGEGGESYAEGRGKTLILPVQKPPAAAKVNVISIGGRIAPTTP